MASNCIFVGAMVTILDGWHCCFHLIFLYSIVLLQIHLLLHIVLQKSGSQENI